MSSPGLKAHIPNALTCTRVLFSAAFFAVLAVYQFPVGPDWAMPVATGLFIVAALTDALDGYLARKWNVVSVLGRVMDPFADKVLILGAFVMLAGPGFAMFEGWSMLGISGRSPSVLRHQITGVQTWMVVVILARELLVTTIRAVLEGRGIDFSASWSGKAKMVVQSIAVPIILLLVMLSEKQSAGWLNSTGIGEDRPELMMTARAAVVVAWMATIVTAISAVPYVTRALSALRPSPVKEVTP